MSAHLIAGFTLREAFQRRIVLAAALLTVGFLALFGLGVWLGYRDLQSDPTTSPEVAASLIGVLLAGGLWSLNFIASMLAIFLSVGSLSGELDQGTLHAIAARPVRRSEIVLGKFAGFTLMLAVFIGVSASAMIVTVAVITGRLVATSWLAPPLMLAASMTLVGLAMAGSSRIGTLANGVMVFTLFSTALVAGVLEQVAVLLDNALLFDIGVFSGVVLPTRALWSMASAQLSDGGAFTEVQAGTTGALIAPSGWTLLVGALHLAVTLGIALRAFGRRDF